VEDRFFSPLYRYKTYNVVPETLKARHVHFVRERDSHLGLSQFKNITALSANNVNQSFLEEICELKNLKSLTMKIVTAQDLGSLSKLQNLKKIHFQAAHKTHDFSFVLKMPNLKGFYIAHAKRLEDLNFLSEAHHLKRVGIEGSMVTLQKIDSLAPFSEMQSLKELYLRSVQLRDKDLTYLAQCPNLKKLECARFAPKKSFQALRVLMPKLKCKWCDKYELPKSTYL